MATTGSRNDPFHGFSFLVEIDSITRGAFRECSGLDTTTDPVDYREGADAPHVRKLPGLTKYSNISLKRGITLDQELWEWRQKVVDGKMEEARKHGSIILLNEKGEKKLRWDFIDGWPTKWTGPSFNATSNDVAIETLEIVHEGIKRA
jgi:phage tail-like protein